MTTVKKTYLRRELAQKDLVIEQMLASPDVRVEEDGTVWIVRSQRPSNKGIKWVVDGVEYRECTIRNGNRRLVYYKGYMLTVPRIVYRKFFGPISPDMEIVHLDGDSTNNSRSNLGVIAESGGAGRALRMFTEPQVLAIRKERAEGGTLKDLAHKYGTSSIVISKIVRGETYKEIGGARTETRKRSIPKGPDSYRSKLTREQYTEILRKRASGVSLAELAGQYSLTKSGISRLCTREKAQIEEFMGSK